MRRAAVVVAIGWLLTGAAAAQSPAPIATPSPADILFEAPQMQSVQPGTLLTYRYHRTSGIAGDPFGPPIDDHIRLNIEAGTTPATRTVRVEMLSGERRRPAGPFEDVTANPVLILFLEHHLDDLARVLGGNPRYIKTAIRAALRDRAAITRVEVSQGGHAVPAWRIEIRPLADDPNPARLRGFETLDYVFVASDAVPGAILSINIEAGPPGGKLLEESLTYDQDAH